MEVFPMNAPGPDGDKSAPIGAGDDGDYLPQII
jgi:hypothetical protein